MAAKPFLLIAAGALLFGCQLSPEQEMVGAWTANRVGCQVPDFPDAELQKRIENGIYASQLKLSADHTFSLTGPGQVGGKWSYANGILTLKPAADSQRGQWRLASHMHQFKVNRDLSQMRVEIPLPFGKVVIVLDKTA